MNRALSSRELSYCGLFGAAAMLLPVIFHLFHLGHVFMPMYLPLVALAFFVTPLAAAATAFIVPLLSGAMTGMPPFYPPVAVFMALELSAMSAMIAFLSGRYPTLNEFAILIPVLLAGRVFYIGLIYVFSLFIQLPAGFMAGLAFLKGWPGLLLLIAVVPPIARIKKTYVLRGKEIRNG